MPLLAVVESDGLRMWIADDEGNLFHAIIPVEACRGVWVGERIAPEDLGDVLDVLLSEEDRAFLDGLVDSGVRDWFASTAEATP